MAHFAVAERLGRYYNEKTQADALLKMSLSTTGGGDADQQLMTDGAAVAVTNTKKNTAEEDMFCSIPEAVQEISKSRERR